MDEDIPNDDQFLELIYEAYKDKGYATEHKAIAEKSFDRAQHFEELVKQGLCDRSAYESYRAVAGETLDMDRSFQGMLISTLKQMALKIAGEDEPLLRPIPIGLLATGEFNAFAMRTPRGGSIVALNHGVISSLMVVFRCAISFITWHHERPFCRDSTQGEYARALVALARSLVSRDLSCLAPHAETLRFPSLGDYHRPTSTFATLMELFILLHEYGHVVGGHLREVRLVRVSLLNVGIYTKSELQEFEADQYAIAKLMHYGAQNGLLASDVALAAGLVMKFFEVCESMMAVPDPSMRTHPPASARWERVKLQTELSGFEGSIASQLDPAFEVIMKSMNV